MQNRMIASVLLLAANCGAAHLSASAERAYEIYVTNLETRLARQHARPETYLAVRTGDASDHNRLERPLVPIDTQVEAVNGGTWEAPGALLHHWRGTAFAPNTTATEMLAVLRDFSRFPMHYAPEVVSARALRDDGETATLAVRFREQRVITIVLDGEYKVESRLTGNRGTAFRAVCTFGRLTIQEQRRSAAGPQVGTMASFGGSIHTGASPGYTVDDKWSAKRCRSRATYRWDLAG